MFRFISFAFFVVSHSHVFIIADKDYRLSRPEGTRFKISSEGCTGEGTIG